MKDDRTYLLHMRDAIKRIQDYTKNDRSAFMATPMMQDATVRNLEILGEATKHLSDALRSANPDVPWTQIAGLRDVLIHGYMGVDLEIIWDVVRDRLPPLADRIARLLGG